MGFQAISIVDNKLAIGPRKVCENINSFVCFYRVFGAIGALLLIHSLLTMCMETITDELFIFS